MEDAMLEVSNRYVVAMLEVSNRYVVEDARMLETGKRLRALPDGESSKDLLEEKLTLTYSKLHVL
jgi:hypothetical protein